jgi:iron(III) transport system substrate-binding protein
MHTRGRPAGVGAAILAAAALLVAGCGSSSSSASPGNGTKPATITLYSGQHQQTTEALVASFERQTGIKVKERDGDEAALAAEIEQEGSASPADVIYTENSPALAALEERNLLSPVDLSTLAAVPGAFSSPGGDWVGISARVSVIIYNRSRLSASQLPRSLLDLADPQWKGKLALAPTETDFQPLITSIAQSQGQGAAVSWLKAVRSNAGSHVEPDNETLVSDINSGQAAIGVINHYYWFRLQKEIGAGAMHSQLAYFTPRDPGYIIDVSGAGVLRSSKHQAAAQALLAYLVSARGQQVMVNSDSFEYPLRAGVAPPPGLRPFKQLQPAPLSLAALGDGSEALRLLQQAQLL